MERLQVRESHGELGTLERWLRLSYGEWIGGNKTGTFSKGRQLGWNRGVCTGVGLWEREEVWVEETPRRPSEPVLGLAGCRAGREVEILDKASGWGG